MFTTPTPGKFTLTLLMATSLWLSPALASGSSSAPPTPTATTKKCKNGQIWDKKTKACVNPQSGALDDDTLYGAVREFAYAGQYENAQNALRAMSDQSDDRVLTYWGFTTRKMGDVPGGMAFYARALEKNPGNLLVRSYMGQSLVEQGKTQEARAQLIEIRARGGTGTWSETALKAALTTGKARDY
jgi:tetratricopeptide (TPR) repeat protein